MEASAVKGLRYKLSTPGNFQWKRKPCPFILPHVSAKNDEISSER